MTIESGKPAGGEPPPEFDVKIARKLFAGYLFSVAALYCLGDKSGARCLVGLSPYVAVFLISEVLREQQRGKRGGRKG